MTGGTSAVPPPARPGPGGRPGSGTAISASGPWAPARPSGGRSGPRTALGPGPSFLWTGPGAVRGHE